MMIPSNIMPIVEQGKFFLSFGTAIWAFFSAYTYVKQSLSETKEGVVSIKTELKDQTQAIVKATDNQTNELRNMSGDVKMLVQAMMTAPALPRARAARAARRKK